MSIEFIKMPDIGEGIAEVELVAWHVQVGDLVAEDQILADVMTDKATVEIPSHVAGRVVSLDVAVGQVVAVGTAIIHIEKSAPARKEPDNNAITPIATSIPEVSTPVSPPSATPAVAKVAPVVAPAATPPAPVATAPVPQPALATAEPGAHPIAAPAVRRRAWELGLDLTRVTPTGPAGRITHADLEAAQAGASQPGVGGRPRLREVAEDHEQAIPVIGLRRKIAQKMQDAKRRIPHFAYVEEVDVTELEALRAQLNAQHGQTRGRLTLLPFLIRAMVLAVRDHPEVNARYDDEAGVLTRHSAIHLGVATQTDGGLMVPVIRHAQTLDLWACAAEVLRLAEAARSGKATREELTGSTITLTSLGALGGIVSTPVINHPEVAIVGTNRIVERPMFKNGLVVARKLMNLSSSFDHRVVDGMNAAEFIQQVRGYLECPATLFID
ncbi:dihydrolipoamide acetyltransferase family protein [Rhodoferax sp.]|uniref:dihydrolipoamide acetyltransferase family protein n=1 Tax=Rhodoferax sp. TaxID=50421 RepID=UPI00263A1706|nr:dihydrolipoamide acetyltransferase family protein [Rhodoferax sp.]MDD2925225.1 dihydrolipoamide acetyltransferase family protein [Rhodoferax sp.]